MKPSNHMGDYCHLIRVNGQRSVVGLGHTQQEAYRNALDLATETWPSVAVVFHLVRPSAYCKDHDSVVSDNERHDVLQTGSGIIRKVVGYVKGRIYG